MSEVFSSKKKVKVIGDNKIFITLFVKTSYQLI